MECALNRMQHTGLLAAEKDIYDIVHTALYDQLLLTPDYKVEVTG